MHIHPYEQKINAAAVILGQSGVKFEKKCCVIFKFLDGWLPNF
jgi:hypothetical protein